MDVGDKVKSDSTHYRSGRPNHGCTSARAIKGGHERNSAGVCSLCGDGPSASISEDGLPELSESRIIALWNGTESGGMVGRYVRFARAVAREAVAADRRAREAAYDAAIELAGDTINARNTEIADLRAQLARQGQGEPVAALTDKGRAVKWNPMYAQEPWVSGYAE